LGKLFLCKNAKNLKYVRKSAPISSNTFFLWYNIISVCLIIFAIFWPRKSGTVAKVPLEDPDERIDDDELSKDDERTIKLDENQPEIHTELQTEVDLTPKEPVSFIWGVVLTRDFLLYLVFVIIVQFWLNTFFGTIESRLSLLTDKQTCKYNFQKHKIFCTLRRCDVYF
jgi:hypothetical protein